MPAWIDHLQCLISCHAKRPCYYFHMTDINVSMNETVTAGVTNLGKEGKKKGWANGFHVHLEIFRGKHATGAVNPVLVNQDIPTVCPYNLI